MSDDTEDGRENNSQRSESNQHVDETDGEPGEVHQRENHGSGRSGPSTVAKAVMLISIVFTVLLFVYAGWQIATPPSTGPPQASVVGMDSLETGSVAVTVRLQNPSDVGLISATVESNCSSPPPEVQFSYVPARSTRTATLVCPPGTTDPAVSVANWVR